MRTKTTLRGKTITRPSVNATLDLFDKMGAAAFLDHFGYRPSTRYFLRARGRSYPSKAIVGVAAGLKPREFFGGVAETTRVLSALAFPVRRADRRVRLAGLDAYRAACGDEGFDDPAPNWKSLPVLPAAYFASGSNRVAEIRGFAMIGADVGCAAPLVRAESEKELLSLAGTDVNVFVDSGAFSEVDAKTLAVVDPISDERWREVLGLYARLAAKLSTQLFVVAPDRVGCQTTTLRRLARFRHEIRDLIRLGARVLVPIQRGDFAQAVFARAVENVLGVPAARDGSPGWHPAIPCKKAATSPDELRAFVEDFGETDLVHLLGLGVRNRNAAEYLDVFVGTSTSVSLDSCWLSANAGRTGAKTRRYTRAQDVAAEVLRRADRYSVALKVAIAISLCLSPAGGVF